jgi:hypothetical protein
VGAHFLLGFFGGAVESNSFIRLNLMSYHLKGGSSELAGGDSLVSFLVKKLVTGTQMLTKLILCLL